MDQAKMKVIYVITNRGERKYWTRIGAAFLNSDGSLNAKLDAIPVTGELHIRDYVPREDVASEGFRTRTYGNNGHPQQVAELS